MWWFTVKFSTRLTWTQLKLVWRFNIISENLKTLCLTITSRQYFIGMASKWHMTSTDEFELHVVVKCSVMLKLLRIETFKQNKNVPVLVLTMRSGFWCDWSQSPIKSNVKSAFRHPPPWSLEWGDIWPEGTLTMSHTTSAVKSAFRSPPLELSSGSWSQESAWSPAFWNLFRIKQQGT